MNKGVRTITGIVDEQVRRWQFEASEHPREQPRRPRPMITVSRQHASGGVELARRVAEKLGYSFWHKEVVHEIATDAHASERLMASFDEHRRNVIAEIVGNLVLVNHSSSEYVRELAKVLHAIATHGGAVIVGRGAQYLLDPKTLFRVRLVAPVEQRIGNLVARGLSPADAAKELAAVDKDRRDFVKGLFHHDPDDALDYDMVLNLDRIGPEAAVGLVLAGFRARFADQL